MNNENILITDFDPLCRPYDFAYHILFALFYHCDSDSLSNDAHALNESDETDSPVIM
jgi:hypothetical protein